MYVSLIENTLEKNEAEKVKYYARAQYELLARSNTTAISVARFGGLSQILRFFTQNCCQKFLKIETRNFGDVVTKLCDATTLLQAERSAEGFGENLFH